MNTDKIKILVVEDDHDFYYLIKTELDKQPDMEVVSCASSHDEAIQSAQNLGPHMVLMDLNLSGNQLDGIEAAREIRLTTDAKVIILTAFESPQIVIDACKNAFASGYIFKSQFSLLVESIRKAASGCTPQEHMIQSLILSDLSPAERTVFSILMGEHIHLLSSQKTISNQKTSLLKKLGLRNAEELIHLFSTRKGES